MFRIINNCGGVRKTTTTGLKTGRVVRSPQAVINSNEAVANIKLREPNVPRKYAKCRHQIKPPTQQVSVPCGTGAGGDAEGSPEGTGKLGMLSASGTHKTDLNQEIWRNEPMSHW